VSRSEKEIQKAIDSKPYFESLGEDLNYDVLSKLITIKEAITRKNTQWVDVRNENKNPTINHPKILQIPFNNLENNMDKLDANKEQIIFCQTGITSKKAISILQKHHFKDSFSLKNGALEVMNHFKKNNYENP
jgi:adenylyltransferase/sulfurtransferase